MHINDKVDMSIFTGTIYEGKTWMQVRRSLSPNQVAKFKSLGKRNRAIKRTQSANQKLVESYQYGQRTMIKA